ncbi:acetylxylan esterase [Propionibacteriaceae bacterium Y2011]
MSTASTEQNPYVNEPDPNRTAEESVRLFADDVYGRPPAEHVAMRWHEVRETPLADDSLRRQLVLELATEKDKLAITLLVHLPPIASRGERGAPAFLGMNFRGNHTTSEDPDVLDLTEPEDPSHGDPLSYDELKERFEIPFPRGAQANRWDYPTVAARGYANITWSYVQLAPDTADIFARGPHKLFHDTDTDSREPSDWGSIGMWAWTMSRVLDALVAGMVPEVDPTTVIAHGHSRLGKTALWAAATDERFAAAISNNSGAMGAALSRPVGETPTVLAEVRPHWFARRFSEIVLAGDPLPVDQPELIAAIAPRPVYVASASEDTWADPEGEFLSWQQASATWEGGAEATAGEFPEPGTVLQPDGAPLGYHLRPGPHSVEAFDWAAWLDWADRWVRPGH